MPVESGHVQSTRIKVPATHRTEKSLHRVERAQFIQKLRASFCSGLVKFRRQTRFLFYRNHLLNKMKLLTHNMLTSKCLKGVTVGYPLAIVAKDIKVSEVDFNSEFIARIIPKLDWATLWKAAESIGHVGELPETLVADFEANEEFLKKVHHVLLEVEVINGDLLCPESGRKFPINDGIPNMLLNEDEV